jgi:hypothetical protein
MSKYFIGITIDEKKNSLRIRTVAGTRWVNCAM